MKTILNVPDTHVPFHDVRALRLVRKVAHALRPDVLVVDGDWIDGSSVSKHRRRGHEVPLAEEGRVGKFELKRLKEAANAKENVFMLGNHEARVEDVLLNDAPGLVGITSVTQLLGLENWKVVPYGELHRVGKMVFCHDQGFSGANAHQQTQALLGKNVIHGHNHNLAISYRGSPTGEAWFGCASGWLGDVNSPAFKYTSAGQRGRWQLGISVIRVEGNGSVHVQPVPIVNYRCVVDGRLYVG